MHMRVRARRRERNGRTRHRTCDMAISTVTPSEPTISPHLEATTHRCSQHNHREFLLRWDGRRTSLADVRRLAETLEQDVARGVRFLPGDVVQIGWVPLRVIELPSRLLSLVEPDFCGAPLRYVQGVDGALHHLRAQDELVERVGLGGLAARPSLTQTARVCEHASSRGLVLDRSEPDHADSGWLVTCAADDEEHAVATTTLYDLVCRFPHLVDFLALPVGATVACTDVGDAIVWIEGREVGAREGLTFAARRSRTTAPLARCGSIR